MVTRINDNKLTDGYNSATNYTCMDVLQWALSKPGRP